MPQELKARACGDSHVCSKEQTAEKLASIAQEAGMAVRQAVLEPQVAKMQKALGQRLSSGGVESKRVSLQTSISSWRMIWIAFA